MDMDNKRHFDLKPEHLWESRPEHGHFYLSTFRDHLWQEHKTRKYLYTLKLRAKEKAAERIAAAKKKHNVEMAKVAAAEEKKAKAAEKLAEKEKKQAARLAEKERKEKEKQDEKERKAAEKQANKAKKAAEKEIAKQRKAEGAAKPASKPRASKGRNKAQGA